MAENTVVKEQLTEEMIEAGAKLTQKLDEQGVEVSLALWFFMTDVNEWRLLFASPAVSTNGPQTFYKKVEEARKSLGVQADRLPLSDIGLIDINSQLAQHLRTGVKTGPEVSRIRFSKNVLNGQFIDDALIYRNAA